MLVFLFFLGGITYVAVDSSTPKEEPKQPVCHTIVRSVDEVNNTKVEELYCE